MESAHQTNSTNFTDSFEQFAESTNPFSKDIFFNDKNAANGPAARAGKRRRIYKPLYSARLS